MYHRLVTFNIFTNYITIGAICDETDTDCKNVRLAKMIHISRIITSYNVNVLFLQCLQMYSQHQPYS